MRTRNRHFVRFAVVAAALLFSVTAVLGAAQFSSPPRLEEVAPAHTIGTGVWLFVVDDGEPMPAISSGGAGQIKIGRLDLDNLESPITWRVVADPADAPLIADHWLVFANGFYWIVFSANDNRDSYLLKLDGNFNRVAKIPVVLNGVDNGWTIVTNDMFLVAEADGVTVGHFLPGFGYRLFRFDTAGALQGTVDIGAPSNGPPSVFKHTDLGGIRLWLDPSKRAVSRVCPEQNRSHREAGIPRTVDRGAEGLQLPGFA